MSSANNPDSPEGAAQRLAQLTERVIALEISLSHSQQMVEELSREMFAQTRRVDALHQELSRLVHKLDVMRDAMPSAPRDPEAEKPPHY